MHEQAGWDTTTAAWHAREHEHRQGKNYDVGHCHPPGQVAAEEPPVELVCNASPIVGLSDEVLECLPGRVCVADQVRLEQVTRHTAHHKQKQVNIVNIGIAVG
jgi:hypothetical protein